MYFAGSSIECFKVSSEKTKVASSFDVEAVIMLTSNGEE